VCAILDQVLGLQIPGIANPRIRRKAAEIAKAGNYNIRAHRDEVLLPLITYWKIFELTGLSPAAEEARTRLAAHLETLDAAAKRSAERLARERVPAGV
jgi:acyl-[acyl-carrier-protein] desaturase